jgi:hypothetical protein
VSTLIRKSGIEFGEHKFGHNLAVGTSEESIWTAGGLFPWDTTWDLGPSVITLASDSASDDAAGIGARVVMVTGQGADGIQKTVSVTMSGTFTQSIGTWSMIYRMIVDDVGDSDTNVGTIQCSYGTWTVAEIAPTDGQTEMAVYRVPMDQKGYLRRVFASGHGTDRADIALYTREAIGKAWRLRVHFHAGGGAVTQNKIPKGLIYLDPGTWIDLRALGTNSSGSEVDAGFDIYMTTNKV